MSNSVDCPYSKQDLKTAALDAASLSVLGRNLVDRVVRGVPKPFTRPFGIGDAGERLAALEQNILSGQAAFGKEILANAGDTVLKQTGKRLGMAVNRIFMLLRII